MLPSLGDLAPSHLLQAAFLDLQVGLGPLCPPIAPGLPFGPGCGGCDGVVIAVSLIIRNSALNL